jgi:hypothetical protein
MQQLAPPPPQCSAVIASSTKHDQNFYLFLDLQQYSSVEYPCLFQAHMLSLEVTGDDFTATVAEPSHCCHLFETQRGNNSWGHPEHLPALHETIHTSENCWNALVLHLHRLHTPFQVSVASLLALKQNLLLLVHYLTP